MSLLSELLLSLWIWTKRNETANLAHNTDPQSVLCGKNFSGDQEPFHTQGLMSPYLRASMTNFKQSPMSWYEVTPTVKNKMKGIYCHFLFAILNQRNSCFLSMLTLSHSNPKLLDKIQIATFQERFENRRIGLRLQFWGLLEKSEEQEGYQICY